MKDMLKDKIAGALYGVAIGDALGAPLEFMSAEQIAQQHGHVTEMIGGGWLGVKPGETTDDTAMTLAVAEGIMESPDNPIPAIGERFIRWAESGPKDIGGTCRCAIWKAATGGHKRPSALQWENAGRETAIINKGRSAGNGALMRAVYPALYYSSALTAAHVTISQGRMTHDDAESTEACQLYSDMVHYLITEAESGETRREKLARIEAMQRDTRFNSDDITLLGRDKKLKPTGYVVDSLMCALYAFWDFGRDFMTTVAFAANMGGDADTIAAICGGLAGAYYGFEAIPERWVAALSEADRKRLDAAVDAAVKNRRRE